MINIIGRSSKGWSLPNRIVSFPGQIKRCQFYVDDCRTCILGDECGIHRALISISQPKKLLLESIMMEL